jgi:hypothetical protein
MTSFLHDLPDFRDLILVVADQKGIDPSLVEKDYWIMHCLWGLQTQGFQFELKGGTSLSKGFGIIHRFSEDIDIRIEPPDDIKVMTGRNHDRPAHIASRGAYYDLLTERIRIPGIVNIARDSQFDDPKLRSAGIRLFYDTRMPQLAGIKEGILLELGFDDTAPNRPVTISSWALDTAFQHRISVADNRAVDVLCYAPTHTFVEKLQTISTKFRQLQTSNQFPANFLRHYYDVYCLLALDEIQDFMRQPAYAARKAQRFRMGDEQVIAHNPAFSFNDPELLQRFTQEFQKTAGLYYQEQLTFPDLIQRIHENLEIM